MEITGCMMLYVEHVYLNFPVKHSKLTQGYLSEHLAAKILCTCFECQLFYQMINTQYAVFHLIFHLISH